MITQEKWNEFILTLEKKCGERDDSAFVRSGRTMEGIVVEINCDKGVDRYLVKWDNVNTWFIRYWYGV
jgi:hypothetical protein